MLVQISIHKKTYKRNFKFYGILCSTPCGVVGVVFSFLLQMLNPLCGFSIWLTGNKVV